MENGKFFIYYIFPMLIYIFGLFGNILGIVVFIKSKNLHKIGPKHIYTFFFLTDSLFLIQLIVNYLSYGWGYDFTILSRYTCKIFWYFNYSFDTFSPYLLVYISVERLVAFKYPRHKLFLRSKRNQIIYLAIVLVYNLILYTPFAIYFDIQTNSNTSSIICDFMDSNSRQILNYIDTVNRVIIPFILMSICSGLLCISIIRISKRIIENFMPNNNKRFYKDIKTALSLIFLNLLYIVLTLPISISTYSSFSDFFFVFTFYLLYLSYSVNFYVVFLFNNLFRNEVIYFVKNLF